VRPKNFIFGIEIFFFKMDVALSTPEFSSFLCLILEDGNGLIVIVFINYVGYFIDRVISIRRSISWRDGISFVSQKCKAGWVYSTSMSKTNVR
jgi:hypothetical protein